MVTYIKVRPYVAQRIGVEKDRYSFKDGNVLLWDKDLQKIDRGFAFGNRMVGIVERIGGLAMNPYECRMEQDKSAEDCTPLPLPTDPEWAMPEEVAAVESVMEDVEEAVVEAAEGLMEDILEDIAKETEGEGGES